MITQLLGQCDVKIMCICGKYENVNQTSRNQTYFCEILVSFTATNCIWRWKIIIYSEKSSGVLKTVEIDGDVFTIIVFFFLQKQSASSHVKLRAFFYIIEMVCFVWWDFTTCFRKCVCMWMCVCVSPSYVSALQITLCKKNLVSLVHI